MRIGVDARLVGAGLGIATYVTSLAEHLPDGSVVWLGAAAGAPPGAEVVDDVARWPHPLLDGPIGRRRLRALDLDVVHFTGNTGWGRRGPVPAVLTVHDLIPFHRDVRRSPRQLIGHAYVRRTIGGAIASATEVVAVSATTAGDVLERFGRRCTVIPHGIRRPSVVAAHDPAAPYLVAFGGRDPRKAVDLALAVRRAAGAAAGPLHVLARAGLPPGFDVDTAAERAAGAVVVHGPLSRQARDELLAGATALLYLSRDEGFGFPVLEAMAAGTPVVTGNAPATREIGGSAALLVDPAAVVASATAHVEALLADSATREAVVVRGREQAAHYTWEAVAQQHLEVYRRAAA